MATPPKVPNLTTPVPQRSDPANFRARADTLMTELPPMVDGINDVVDYVNATRDATAIDIGTLEAIRADVNASANEVRDNEVKVENNALYVGNLIKAFNGALDIPSFAGKAGYSLTVNAKETGADWEPKTTVMSITAEAPEFVNPGVSVTLTMSAASFLSGVDIDRFRVKIGRIPAFDLTPTEGGATYDYTVNHTEAQAVNWEVYAVDTLGNQSSHVSGRIVYASGSEFIVTPEVINPPSGAIDVPEQPVIKLSEFSTVGAGDNPTGMQIRVYDSGNNIIHESPIVTWGDYSEYVLPVGVLEDGESVYMVDGRYRGDRLGWSEWSEKSSFTTEASFLPEEPGQPWGGGFFCAYYTINGGTEMLITADKSSEQSLKWKTERTATSGTSSGIDGWANTQAMIAAGKALHPAAAACVDWRGGGFTDWFLPAKNQRELEYYNFKPSTRANNTINSGINANAIPPRPSSYTDSDPAQTSIPAFKKGCAQAFNDDGGTAMGYYWTSTQTSATNAWSQFFGTGGQGSKNKDNSYLVRPVRSLEIN